jgi:hypothetical protein
MLLSLLLRRTPEAWEWNQVNINNPLVQDVVKDSVAVQAAHDAVGASFQLASCGWVVGPLGDRSYWDTVLPSTWAISSIDMNVGNTVRGRVQQLQHLVIFVPIYRSLQPLHLCDFQPVDPAYGNITHRDAAHKWVIPWAEDDPGLTAPELWLNRTLLHAADAIKYGCGGLMMIHWRTRMTSPQVCGCQQRVWSLPSCSVLCTVIPVLILDRCGARCCMEHVSYLRRLLELLGVLSIRS